MTTGGVITELGLDLNGGAIEMAIGPDGRFWFTEIQVGSLFSDSTTGTDTGAFPGYGNGAAPRGITTGLDGNLWITRIPSIERYASLP